MYFKFFFVFFFCCCWCCFRCFVSLTVLAVCPPRALFMYRFGFSWAFCCSLLKFSLSNSFFIERKKRSKKQNAFTSLHHFIYYRTYNSFTWMEVSVENEMWTFWKDVKHLKSIFEGERDCCRAHQVFDCNISKEWKKKNGI